MSLGKEEMYLTAHHAEDQAETLFSEPDARQRRRKDWRAFRFCVASKNGWVARPLLDRHRADLEKFLLDRNLEWLTDPSNEDTTFDRNYLRQEMFPLLEKRWPGLSHRLSRTARNARMTATAMAAFIENQSGDLIRDKLKMPLHKLLELDSEMQPLILRQWLRRHEIPVLPESRLREFLEQLSGSIEASEAEVQWGDWIIKRYQHDLWLHQRKPFMACPEIIWDSGMDLDLGSDSGRLRLLGKSTPIPQSWLVRARDQGDRIRLLEHGPSQKIKHFFQLTSIPPWLRSGIPVLEWDGEAVALGDWIIGHRLQDWLIAHDLEYQWQPTDPVLARLRSECQR